MIYMMVNGPTNKRQTRPEIIEGIWQAGGP